MGQPNRFVHTGVREIYIEHYAIHTKYIPSIVTTISYGNLDLEISSNFPKSCG